MPGARRRGRPRTVWTDIKTWTGLPVEQSVRTIEINGESTSMVRPTLGWTEPIQLLLGYDYDWGQFTCQHVQYLSPSSLKLPCTRRQNFATIVQGVRPSMAYIFQSLVEYFQLFCQTNIPAQMELKFGVEQCKISSLLNAKFHPHTAVLFNSPSSHSLFCSNCSNSHLLVSGRCSP